MKCYEMVANQLSDGGAMDFEGIEEGQLAEGAGSDDADVGSVDGQVRNAKGRRGVAFHAPDAHVQQTQLLHRRWKRESLQLCIQ